MLLKFAIELMQEERYSTLWLGRRVEDIEKELREKALLKLKENYHLNIEEFNPATLTKTEAYEIIDFLYGTNAISAEAYDELDYAFVNIFTEEILEDGDLLYDPSRI
jgi:hypothetical protein